MLVFGPVKYGGLEKYGGVFRTLVLEASPFFVSRFLDEFYPRLAVCVRANGVVLGTLCLGSPLFLSVDF